MQLAGIGGPIVAAAPGATSIEDLEALQILAHPLVNVKISELRNKDTTPHRFRQLIGEITRFLGSDASKNLSVEPMEGLETPVGPYTGWVLGERVGLAPILRAGMQMTEPMLELFPEAQTFHLGLFRDRHNFTPTEYYSKLPANLNQRVSVVYLLDPVVATGGTACAAVAMLQDAGVSISNIKLLCVIASMPGLQEVLSRCPGLEIYVAAVDQEMNADGLIVPGIGDCGDRLFLTHEK